MEKQDPTTKKKTALETVEYGRNYINLFVSEKNNFQHYNRHLGTDLKEKSEFVSSWFKPGFVGAKWEYI